MLVNSCFYYSASPLSLKKQENILTLLKRYYKTRENALVQEQGESACKEWRSVESFCDFCHHRILRRISDIISALFEVFYQQYLKTTRYLKTNRMRIKFTGLTVKMREGFKDKHSVDKIYGLDTPSVQDMTRIHCFYKVVKSNNTKCFSFLQTDVF